MQVRSPTETERVTRGGRKVLGDLGKVVKKTGQGLDGPGYLSRRDGGIDVVVLGEWSQPQMWNATF